MGCTFDTDLKRSSIDKNHEKRHGRTGTIDARKKTNKLVDQIIENVTLCN